MAKTTKGGRVMNPTDAARKLARKREINRNKKERDLQRATPKEVPEINRRLEEVLAEEEAMKSAGRPITKDLHIRKKVLLDAIKLAVAKERENTMKELFGEEGVQTTPFGHGVPQRKPEDSVYYHPITNPTGMPPAGRPQRYKDDVELMDPAKAEKLEEERRARAAAAVSAATQQAKEQPANTAPANILPPPPGPPPGFLAPPAGPPPGVLPPPTGPPPGVLPPPAGPPPGVLPSPVGPPPSGIMPPPPGPLPGFPASGLQPAAGPFAGHLPTTSGAPQVSPTKQPTASVVAGEATAVRTIPAHQDPRLKAMVPATVRAKRQKFKSSTKLQPVPNLDVNAGFGLAPQLGATDTQDAGEAAYAEFMDEIAKME